MKIPPIRIDWKRASAVVLAAIESQEGNRPGAQKRADAAAIVCRELGIAAPSAKTVEFVESVVHGLFEQRKAKRDAPDMDEVRKSFEELEKRLAQVEREAAEEREAAAAKIADAERLLADLSGSLRIADEASAKLRQECDALIAKVAELEAAEEADGEGKRAKAKASKK